MGRLARSVRRFRTRNPRTLRLVNRWLLPVIIAGSLLTVVHARATADTAPTATQVQAYLEKNPLIVFSEADDGYQQVFFKYRDEFLQLSSGKFNSAWTATSDHYVAWQQERPAGAQLFLHDLLTGATTQITSDGLNAEPSINENTVVWRKYVNETWQIYYYNGLSTVQLTSGPSSYFYPTTNGKQIIYTEQYSDTQWRVHSYNIQTRQDTIVKEGDRISAGYPRFDEDGKIVTSYRPDPVQD